MTNTNTNDPLANVKPVRYDNPWDLVPDQPVKSGGGSNNNSGNNNANAANVSIGSSNCDSSSGVSSCASSSNNAAVAAAAAAPKQQQQLQQQPASASIPSDWSSPFGEGAEVNTTTNSGKWVDDFDVVPGGGGEDRSSANNEFWSLDGSGILDDPFDAEWAALAARNAAAKAKAAAAAAAASDASPPPPPQKQPQLPVQTAFELQM